VQIGVQAGPRQTSVKPLSRPRKYQGTGVPIGADQDIIDITYLQLSQIVALITAGVPLRRGPTFTLARSLNNGIDLLAQINPADAIY
jgi:hypothetical protein